MRAASCSAIGASAGTPVPADKAARAAPWSAESRDAVALLRLTGDPGITRDCLLQTAFLHRVGAHFPLRLAPRRPTASASPGWYEIGNRSRSRPRGRRRACPWATLAPIAKRAQPGGSAKGLDNRHRR
jgi:hypothetical protein